MTSILVNGRFQTRRVTGVERYAAEITRRFGDEIRIVGADRVRPGWIGHLWEQFSLPRLVPPGSVLWSPANTGPIAVPAQVVTIHDLAPVEHPEWFAPPFAAWYRFLWPRLARKVRKIIAVSAFSKERIVARLGVSSSRVVVIPNGVDAARFRPTAPGKMAAVRQKYGLDRDFLLFVGSLQPRKNLRRLLDAWGRVNARFPRVELAIAGAGGRAFRGVGLPDARPGTRLLGYVPDADLPALYSAALAFVQPSLYEGSGLTVLEALACGCPVVVSNIPALPEAAGEAGVYFDPRDVGGMAFAIGGVVENQELREKLRAAGAQRASLFSWDRAAEQVWQVLKTAAAGET